MVSILWLGCWDWHSAVHTHFLLVRCLRSHSRQIDGLGASAARQALRRHLTPENIAVEVASLEREAPHWECPYGLAWVLCLAQELEGWDADLSEALKPLERAAVARLTAWLEYAAVDPNRRGSHGNSAFAARLILQHSRARSDGVPDALVHVLHRVLATCKPARASDEGHPFLCPLLVEVQLDLAMAASNATQKPYVFDVEEVLCLEPVPGDPHDIRTCHALGLNFSRAEGMAALAAASSDHEAAQNLLELAKTHLLAAAPYLRSGGWMGDHWIGTFAVLALEACLRAESALYPH